MRYVYCVSKGAKEILQSRGSDVNHVVNCANRGCRHESHPDSWDEIQNVDTTGLVSYEIESWPGWMFNHLETPDEFERAASWWQKNHQRYSLNSLGRELIRK